MAYLLAFLPVLACPLGMGLVMGLMMRAPTGSATAITRELHTASQEEVPVDQTRRGGLCLNWKVVAGLAMVGVGTWIVAPSLVGSVLPVLILLACPLSMLFMLRGIRGGQCATPPTLARRPAGSTLTRDEQLARLNAELTHLEARHETVRHEIHALESSRVPTRSESARVPSAMSERTAIDAGSSMR